MNFWEIFFIILNTISLAGCLIGIYRLSQKYKDNKTSIAAMGKISGQLLLISLMGTHVNLISIQITNSLIAQYPDQGQSLTRIKTLFLMQTWLLSKTTSCTTGTFYIISVFHGIQPLLSSLSVSSLLHRIKTFFQNTRILYLILGCQILTVIVTCIVDYEFYWVTFYMSTFFMAASLIVLFACPFVFASLLIVPSTSQMKREIKMALYRLIFISVAVFVINGMSFYKGHLLPIIQDGWMVKPIDPYDVTVLGIGHLIALIGAVVCCVFIFSGSSSQQTPQLRDVKKIPSQPNLSNHLLITSK